MKNKGITIFLIIMAIVIVIVMVIEFLSTRPDRQEANPYQYSIDEFREVDSTLIGYEEIKNFKLNMKEPAGIAWYGNKIYVTGDQKLLAISENGALDFEVALSDVSTAISASENMIVVGLEKYLAIYNLDGTLVSEWDTISDRSYITSLAVWDNNIFIADAANREVFIYSTDGELITEFEGKTSDQDIHGFIVPSPFFDLAVNAEGELWVVNPGKHALEEYTFEGNLRSFWENASMDVEGFSGCCNPAHFAFLPDGSFVTSEKGMARIKVYKASGELLSVVAPSDKFENEDYAPDLAVDSSGNIYALDFIEKTIRLFQPI